MNKVPLAPGCWFVDIPEAGLSLLCGCPENAVKFLYRAGCIRTVQRGSSRFETGPTGILLSEVAIQNGAFCNLGEFPVLHMLYLQGLLIPGHPNNDGRRPLVIGLADQVEAQKRYLFAGNYGLSTEDEMVAAGMPPAEAQRQMRMKLSFAYGRIRPSEELLDLRVFDNDAVKLAPGVFLHRTSQNVYEFLHQGQCVEVDLNLRPGERYGAPYELPRRSFPGARFAVVHMGDGDGWDPTRPCTGSLVIHGDERVLVDAGPNLSESLDALGVGVNGVHRLVQTHAHDDHFVGLTTLMRSETRIKYHAVPWVRASVEKKFEALTGLGSADFARFFEVRDLIPEQWNDLDGLEVLPLFSPHPVETTVFRFRVAGEGGWRTYAHWADIASFDVLDAMATGARPGLEAHDVARVKARLREPADVKKIDIGGGSIHGRARDFAGDGSGTLLFSHTGRELTPEELSWGRRPEFGEATVLWPAETSSVSPRPSPPAPKLASQERAIRALFGDETVSDALVARLGKGATEVKFPAGEVLKPSPVPGLFSVLSGAVRLRYGPSYQDLVGVGGFFGEADVLFRQVSPRWATADTDVTLLLLPAESLEDCPLLLWHLRESFERRLKAVLTTFHFEWRPEYAVGVPILDAQHQQLFERIAAIGDAVGSGAASSVVSEHLRTLRHYTEFHFKTEHDLMERCAYPVFAEHREEHRKLAEAIRQFSEDYQLSGAPLRHELMEFLKNWLLRHTLLEDRKYMGHLTEEP